ncbi:hypothetical protein GAY28_15825 [Azospirillum brasilense]|nr:hypothetical protein [Azospirillum brasilense]
MAGAAWAARFYNGEIAETGDHAVMCWDEGGIVVFRHADAELVARCADALNTAQAAADEMLSPAQIRDVVHPCLADPEGSFGVVFEGMFAPDAEEHAPAAPKLEKFKFTGSAKQRIEAYFFGYDGATAGTPLEVLTKGRRGEPKARIEAGYRDQQAGTEPKHPRPDAKVEVADESAETAADQGSDTEGQADAEVEQADQPPDDDVPVDADPTIDAPFEADESEPEPAEWTAEQGRVGVQQDGATGQWVMFDLKERQPLVDAPGPNSGETWANQINGYFADRLGDVPRAELITAAKTPAMGSLLSAARPAPTNSNLFAAV